MRIIGLTVLTLALALALSVGAGQVEVLLWPGYLAVAAAAVFAAVAALRPRAYGGFGGACLVAGGAFVATVVGRALATPVDTLARVDLHQALACGLVYLGVGMAFDGRRERRAIAGCLVVLVLVNSGIAAYQFFVRGDFHPLAVFGFHRDGTDGEGSGFFNGGNQLSGLLGLLSFLPLAYALFGSRGWGARVFYFSLGLAGLGGVAISTSRGGFLATAIGGCVFVVLTLMVLFVRFRRKGRKAGILVGVGLLVVSIIGLGAGGWKVLTSEHGKYAMFEQDHSQQMRFELWDMALEVWGVAPIFGTGANTFQTIARQIRPSTHSWVGSSDVDPNLVHNDWLQLLAEYGLVGLGVFAFAFGLHLVHGLVVCFRRRDREATVEGWPCEPDVACALGSIAGLVAFAAHSVYDFNGHIVAVSMAAACLLGFLARPAGPAALESSTGRRRWRAGGVLGCVALLAGGVYLLSVGVPSLRSSYYLTKASRAYETGGYLYSVALLKKADAASGADYRVPLAKGRAFIALADVERNATLRRSWLLRAIESLDAAKTLNPGDLDTLIHLADALSLVGGFESADEIYQEAFAAGPTFRVNFVRYADHLMRVGDLAKAKDYYEKALTLHWHDEASQRAREVVAEIEAELAAGEGAAPSDPPAR